MEYKKDKRTKNLTLRDIHVGDWVQVWSEITERYSPPLKIIAICDDGTIYLATSDEERATPLEEDIKNVDALPITPELLEGFGLEVVPKSYYSIILYNVNKICELLEVSYGYIIRTPYGYCKHFHEFMDCICDDFPEVLNLEWKGIDK